ncbi:MAG: DUF3108 domain-containing protein [Pseudomonadota bacterium]
MTFQLNRFAAGAAVAAALAAGGAAAVGPSAAEARAPIDMALSYQLSVTGLVIGALDVTLKVDEANYEGALNAQTSGLAGWFAQAKAESNGAGAVDAAGKVTPATFNVRTDTGKKTLNVTMDFEGDAPKTVTAEPPYQPRHYEVDPTTQSGALDPIGAMVAAVTSVSADGGCNRVIPVFDGRRRFDVVLGAPTETGELNGKPFVQCPAAVKRVAGYKEKAMAKPDLTFQARFSTDDGEITLPLQAWADLPVGYVALTLVN